jgi:hypothetical protein
MRLLKSWGKCWVLCAQILSASTASCFGATVPSGHGRRSEGDTRRQGTSGFLGPNGNCNTAWPKPLGSGVVAADHVDCWSFGLPHINPSTHLRMADRLEDQLNW